MVDMLQTAVSGLMAFRAAMATTGHNIANVNTPYYSRQRVELNTPTPEQQSYGYMGRGVNIESVARVYDGFVMQQLRGHQSGVSQYDTLNTLTGQMSSLLGDTDVGLTPDVEAFFTALHDVSNSPASITSRQVFLDESRTLTTRIQDIDSALSSLRDSVDTGITNAVTAINNLTSGIAKINQDLSQANKSATNSPNDLMDQRDKMLVDLSKLVGVQIVTQDDGSMNVFMGNGQPLVVGNTSNTLEAAQSGFDPQEITVRMKGQATGSDLEPYISSGELGGYFEFRRSVLNPAQDGLGLMAMGVAKTINDQHKKGMDLNGALGGDLFTVGSPKVLAFSTNSSAVLTAAVTTDSVIPITDAKAAAGATRLVRSDYEINFDGANYTAMRLSDKKTILASGDLAALNTELNKDGLNLTGTPAAGDRFLIRPTRQASAGFELAITDPRKIAVALPIATSASTTNLGAARISAGTVIDVSNPNLQKNVGIKFTSANTFNVFDLTTNTLLDKGVSYPPMVASANSGNSGTATIIAPAVADYTDQNLRNTLEVRFTSATQYDVVDTTTGTTLTPPGGAAYTSGTTIPPLPGPPVDYNGLTFQISGSPQTGDKFGISSASSNPISYNGWEVNITGSPQGHIVANTSPNNSVMATITMPTVVDSKNVNLANPVDIQFTSAAQYNVVDVASGIPLATNQPYNSPTGGIIPSTGTYNGWTVRISGLPQIGDTFHITSPSPGNIVANPDPTNSRTAAITAPTVTDYKAANLTNTVEIKFTDTTHYQLVDVTNNSLIGLSTLYDPTVGAAISPAGYGWTVGISGSPQVGDKFQIKNDGDAFQIKSNIGGIGDNRNALELVKLQTKQQLMGGNDYRGVYATLIAETGAQGRRIDNTLKSQEALFDQSMQSRESISGVSLDEEAADLVRFQQAYEAAAQIIQTSNSLFSTLLSAVRS